MKLHWHNSAMVSAPPRLISRAGGWAWRDFPIRYGILAHPREGLVLIDTGYGQDLFESRDINIIIYRNLLRPKLIPQGDAASVVGSYGASPGDVKHIILTHLHADHICGLSRFPNATIHASAGSLEGWKNPRHFSSTHKGYFPSLLPNFTDRATKPIESGKAVLLPFGSTGYDIFDDGSVVGVDLPGHMRGHMGLLFPQLPTPCFHAADADWTFDSLVADDKPTWPARLIVDSVSQLETSKSVIRRAIACGCEITLSHDVNDGR